jgi:PII-like signaling protein
MKRYLGKKRFIKIYIDSTDTFDGKPLWQVLLNRVKEFGLAGATVTKAVAGIGANTELHTFDIWSLSQKLPVIIEIIDDESKLQNFLKEYDFMIGEGLVVMGDVEVLRYKSTKL